MTREEAKHIVDVAFDVPLAVRRAGEDRTYHEDEIREAKQMAIKALEQEPCDDVVSRQAVLASIKNLYPDMPIVDIFGARRKWLDKYAPYFECENAVEQLPPVRPQEQTGHWILLDECANSGYYCSECQKKLVKEGWSKTVKNIKFCPNCGARMVEPQESEGKK